MKDHSSDRKAWRDLEQPRREGLSDEGRGASRLYMMAEMEKDRIIGKPGADGWHRRVISHNLRLSFNNRNTPRIMQHIAHGAMLMGERQYRLLRIPGMRHTSTGAYDAERIGIVCSPRHSNGRENGLYDKDIDKQAGENCPHATSET